MGVVRLRFDTTRPISFSTLQATSLELAAGAVTANDPEAMAFASVMGFLPLVRKHRPIANFDDQITNSESRLFGHPHEIAVSPLRSMIVDHVGNLGE